MKTVVSCIALVCLACVAANAHAQSPNTSAIVVIVSDQSGAVVADAKVSVINTLTGDVREAPSGSEGSSTCPAPSLTGIYKVTVSKQGFGDEERNDVTLRGGETATLRVKLLVGAEKSEVTVYRTAAGVRADPQIGRRNDAAQIDQTPILGRKVTSVPPRSGAAPGDGQEASHGLHLDDDDILDDQIDAVARLQRHSFV